MRWLGIMLIGAASTAIAASEPRLIARHQNFASWHAASGPDSAEANLVTSASGQAGIAFTCGERRAHPTFMLLIIDPKVAVTARRPQPLSVTIDDNAPLQLVGQSTGDKVEMSMFPEFAKDLARAMAAGRQVAIEIAGHTQVIDLAGFADALGDLPPHCRVSLPPA